MFITSHFAKAAIVIAKIKAAESIKPSAPLTLYGTIEMFQHAPAIPFELLVVAPITLETIVPCPYSSEVTPTLFAIKS